MLGIGGFRSINFSFRFLCFRIEDNMFTSREILMTAHPVIDIFNLAALGQKRLNLLFQVLGREFGWWRIPS